ncbi:hypothetical protein ACT3TY_17335 [Halomonas sp. AOP22-C1-8]|jgi:hypothetical protein|uniref:hypothetical protein n=1 Tax=Halomonas sp. AOP22-C1-8 TaxID=3457717 RepID=UPI0040335BB5
MTVALLPLGILFAALFIFGSGLVWARRRDRQEQIQTILEKVEPWSGSRDAAEAWYRNHSIAALGNLTAADLVAQGRANDVLTYLAHIEENGYA